MLNLGKFLNKKFIFIFIIVLLLIGGGFFWWQWQEYQADKKFGEMTVGELLNFGVLPKNFIVNETSEGIFLENKNLGINFKVPKDWEFVGYMDNFVDLKSPDYETDPDSFSQLKGCLIRIEISYYTLFTSSNLINRIDRIQKGNLQFESENEEVEIIKISGKDVLKSVKKGEQSFKEGLKEVIEIGIPFPDAVAEVKFITVIFEEETKCAQEFDKFLETVSID